MATFTGVGGTASSALRIQGESVANTMKKSLRNDEVIVSPIMHEASSCILLSSSYTKTRAQNVYKGSIFSR